MNTTSDKPKQSNRRSGKRSADRLYSILASMGAGWQTSAGIADVMGKARLNVSESAALKALADAGRIEVRTVDATDYVKRLEYRVIVSQPGAGE